MKYTKFRLKLQSEIIDEISSITHGVDLLQQSLMVSLLMVALKRRKQCCDLQVVMKLNGKVILWNVEQLKSNNLTFEQYYKTIFCGIKWQLNMNSQLYNENIETVFWGNEYSEKCLNLKNGNMLIRYTGAELIGIAKDREIEKLRVKNILGDISSILSLVTVNISVELEGIQLNETETEIITETFEVEEIGKSTESLVKKSSANQYIPVLIELWKKVLDINICPIDKPFFDLGGDSVSVFKLKNLVEEQWECSFSPIDFFDYPTIIQFADFMEKNMKEIAGGN